MSLKDLLFNNGGTKQTLAKNTFWLGGIEALSKIIMLVVTIAILRYLGQKEFGNFNFAASYVSVIMIFSDFGVSTILTRDVAKNKDRAEKYLANTLGIKLAASVFCLILVAATIPFLGPNRVFGLLIILATLYNISLQFQGLLVAVLSAFEKMELVFVIRMIFYVGIAAAAFATIKFNLGINMLIMGYLAAGLVSLAAAFYLVAKMKIAIRVAWDRIFWKDILKESFPVFGFLACSQIYGNLDTLLISRNFGNVDVGVYQAAYKVFYAFQSVNVINTATFPRISALIQEKRAQTLEKLVRAVVGISLLGLIPLGLVISWKSQMIVGLIYGSSWLVAAPIMVNLIWVGVINYFRVFSTNFLIARGEQHAAFYAVMAGVIANAGLNWFVMPKMGFGFSSVALLISEILIMVIAIGFLIRKKELV